MEQTKAKRKQNENINGYFLLKNQKTKKNKNKRNSIIKHLFLYLKS